MQAVAVVLDKPEQLGLKSLALEAMGKDDIVVDVCWSGISTGTEKLLWSGRMPPFPGLGYPLVPGYEAAGRVIDAGDNVAALLGETVFVPGASCFGEVRGLFGGASQRLVTRASRAVAVDPALGPQAALLALAATAYHAVAGSSDRKSELIVGHGVVGRLLARITMALGAPAPTVWEHSAERRQGTFAYPVIQSSDDSRRDYAVVCDASGDASLINTLIARTAKGGEVVLAGFYAGQVGFDFVPAFLRETRLRVAAEWTPADLSAVARLVADGALSLDGLITHTVGAEQAAEAYRTAFEDPACLKMVLNWSTH